MVEGRGCSTNSSGCSSRHQYVPQKVSVTGGPIFKKLIVTQEGRRLTFIDFERMRKAVRDRVSCLLSEGGASGGR